MIGRNHPDAEQIVDIDLSPYKGSEWGVSKKHAKLIIKDEGVTLTDLNSINGTYIEREKITPNIPQDLGYGKIIHLGKVKIQVLIYHDA